jgi:transposase-like protein
MKFWPFSRLGAPSASLPDEPEPQLVSEPPVTAPKPKVKPVPPPPALARAAKLVKHENRKKRFLELYEKNRGYIHKTCKEVGITRQSYLNWREKYPAFNAKCVEIEEGLKDLYESTLTELAIDERNDKSVHFYLERKAKDRGYITRTETTGSDGQPLQLISPVVFATIIERAHKVLKAKPVDQVEE